MNVMAHFQNKLTRTERYLLGIFGVLFLVALVGMVWVGLHWRQTTAGNEPTVVYVLDVSARMGMPASNQTTTRLQLAQNVLAEVIRPNPNVTAGLRVFGAGTNPVGCQDTDLIVPLGKSQQPQISQSLRTLESGLHTDAALAHSMIAAIRDLSDTEGPHTLIVVTGGEDSCLGEAEALVAAEAARAGIDLQTFVVGFDVASNNNIAIKNMIEALGNDSQYIEAGDEATLATILQAINAQAEARLETAQTTTSASNGFAATISAIIASQSTALPTATPLPPTATATAIVPTATNLPATIVTTTATATTEPTVEIILTATEMPATTAPIILPTATRILPTVTWVAPTATWIAPTATWLPPTATRIPPTATWIAPTWTAIPPTATWVAPTATWVAPTATWIAPTVTWVAPTNTPVPAPPATSTPVPPPPATSTPVPPPPATNTPAPPSTNTPQPPPPTQPPPTAYPSYP